MGKSKKNRKNKNEEVKKMENEELLTNEEATEENSEVEPEVESNENSEVEPEVESNENSEVEPEVESNENSEVEPEVESNENSEVEPEVEPDELLGTIKNGTISGCKKLYLREEPSKESKPLEILDEGCTVYVDLDNSTELFYKVNTEDNLEGFCVKEFVKID